MAHQRHPRGWPAEPQLPDNSGGRSSNAPAPRGDRGEQAMMMQIGIHATMHGGGGSSSDNNDNNGRGGASSFGIGGGGGGGGGNTGVGFGGSATMHMGGTLNTDLHPHNIPLAAPAHAPATMPRTRSMQGATTLLPPLAHAHRASQNIASATQTSMAGYAPLPGLTSTSGLHSDMASGTGNLGGVPGGDATGLGAEHDSTGSLNQPVATAGTGAGAGFVPGAGPSASLPPGGSELPWNASAGTADRGGGTTPSSPYPPTSKQIRRRMRMITSCLECRRRKLKCDKSQPCGNCDKFRRDCLYLGPKLDEASQLRLTQMKEKVGSLERQLERDVAHNNSPAAKQQRKLAHDVEDEFADDRDLEPNELYAVDLTYEDDADGGMDDLIDLGVAVGRVRITERISGLPRPGIAEEISAGVDGKPGPPPIPLPPHLQGTAPEFSASMSSTSWPDFLRPSASYIPPSSNFFMGQASGAHSFESLLPTRGAADRLIQQYFDSVHPVARCVHRPSFQAQYADFWDHVYQNVEPRPSLQALIFAAMFSASVSMDEDTAMQEFGRTQKSLYETCKLGTESALSKANFLRTTRFETIQAFVMYLLPLCRDEVSRAHSVLVGAAVRMAECMGLHRDGESYGLNPLDTHVRRLVWHQLCFLDIRTCEAQGPKPAIRREDFDTKLPLNCDESQLSRSGPSPMPADRWTSTLLTLIRFEITEMMRIIWVDRRKLEAKQMTLTAVLTKIENFRKRMFEKYDRYLNDSIAIQRYSKLVMNLFLYRLHAMTLHAFHKNVTTDLPPRLNSVLITSGIMIIEIGIQLERNPNFYQWAWYSGAYHQFQSAMLLASEVYFNPQTRQAERIWGCLDYVFDTDRRLPPEVKGMRILGEIMYKTSMYQRMRKLRPPMNMPLAPNRQKSAGSSQAQAQAQAQAQEQASSSMHRSHVSQTQGFDVQAASMQRGLPISHMIDPQPSGIPPSDTFAGVSDGQTLWSIAAQHQTTDLSGGPNLLGDERNPAVSQVSAAQAAASVQQGLDIDWDVINNLFTNDPNTGDLSISGFSDPALTMNWEHGM